MISNKNAILTIVLLIASTSSLLGQRTKDWAIDELIAPLEIRSDDSSTSLRVTFRAILLSGDSVGPGDTLLTLIRVLDPTDGNSQLVSTGVGATLLTRRFAEGDTGTFNVDVFVQGWLDESANVVLQVSSSVINRGNGPDNLFPESQEDLVNNTVYRNLIWYNKRGWGVGLSNLESDDVISLYPNPASNEVRVANLPSDVSKIVIIDRLGAEVRVYNPTAGLFNGPLDVSGIKSGTYSILFTGEHTRTTKQLIILNDN